MTLTHLSSWQQAARRIGGTVETAPDHRESRIGTPKYAKQSGAMYALYVPLEQNWFDGYSWVIRINPDVYPLNVEPMFSMMHDPDLNAILANCACSHNHTLLA